MTFISKQDQKMQISWKQRLSKFPAFIVDHIDEEIENKLTGKLAELLKCETFELLI